MENITLNKIILKTGEIVETRESAYILSSIFSRNNAQDNVVVNQDEGKIIIPINNIPLVLYLIVGKKMKSNFEIKINKEISGYTESILLVCILNHIHTIVYEAKLLNNDMSGYSQ